MGAQDVTMVTNGVPYILRNFVNIFIDGTPYLPQIQPSATTVCINQNVNFSATWPTAFPVLGYRWNFGDPGSGAQNTSALASPSHSYANPGTYLVTLQTNSNCCGWSKPDTIEIEVLPDVTPQVFITASSLEICQGETVTLGAVPYFGGPTPTFQWFQNGVQQGTGLTYTPATVTDGDQFYVLMTSSWSIAAR
jgi:PKD repeat protein